jgi:hypothetical protein
MMADAGVHSRTTVRVDNPSNSESESKKFRGWLLTLATLTASVTYSSALNPPGGVWQADDAANGYIAGRPVLLDKFPRQYLAFYYCNITSFGASVTIIALLSITKLFTPTDVRFLNTLLALDMLAMTGAVLIGSSSTTRLMVLNIMTAVFLVLSFLVWKLKALYESSSAPTSEISPP